MTMTNVCQTRISKRPEAVVLLGGIRARRFPLLKQAAVGRDLKVLAIDHPDLTVEALLGRQPRADDLPNIEELAIFDASDDCRVIAKVVDEWVARYDIRAVIPLVDVRSRVAAILGSILGCEHAGTLAGQVCSDKQLQRALLGTWSPRSQYFDPLTASGIQSKNLTFPAVVKPLRLHSAQGVRLVNDLEELWLAVQDRRFVDGFLIEEFLPGREYSVECLVLRGEIMFTNVTEKPEKSASKVFIEDGHFIPPVSLDLAKRTELLSVNTEIISKLEFRTGMTHAEYRLAADGRVKLVEIAARPPGENLLPLIQLSTGFDVEKALLETHLGEAVEPSSYRRNSAILFLLNKPGCFLGVSSTSPNDIAVTRLDEQIDVPILEDRPADAPSSIREIATFKKAGAILSEPECDLDRCAHIILDAPNEDELLKLWKSAKENVSADVRPKEQ